MEPKLRWGILSTARIAQRLFMPGVQASAETELAAIASRDLNAARAVAAEFDIPRAYGSYDELLADDQVDAIYNPLPNSLHAQWTIRAAQAGKHVLCEKPLARSASDAHSAANACQEANVLLMEAFMWRHHPQHARVRALIESGEIGEPRTVRGSFTYVIAAGVPNVRLQSTLEGGSLMDVGCYPVNVARWVFGAEPLEVVAQQVVDPAFGVDTTFAGVLRFSDGRRALIDSSFAESGKGEYEISGTAGRLVVERAYRPDTHPGRIHVVKGDEHRIDEVPPADQFAAEADHFARSVRAGKLLPPAEDGVSQAHVIEALYSSAESGRVVSLT